MKNVFVLPGILIAFSFDPSALHDFPWTRIFWGMLAICIVASSNYVINEVLDAPSDLSHPIKRFRPVPSGKVNIPLAYVQWIVLAVIGIGLGFSVATSLGWTMISLWVMGCIYNIRPMRSKELPYVDVLTEAINNPIRLLAGFFMVHPEAVPPVSLQMSYWMVGCYFMAIKRFAEYREIGNAATSGEYRKSFRFYNEERLLVSIMFYAANAMLFFGAFIIRYRLELILAFPLVALVMAVYLHLGFRPTSAAQHPEKLHREPLLMWSVSVTAVVMAILIFVDIPWIYEWFQSDKIHEVRRISSL